MADLAKGCVSEGAGAEAQERLLKKGGERLLRPRRYLLTSSWFRKE
jgi:hypothetical protein